MPAQILWCVLLLGPTAADEPPAAVPEIEAPAPIPARPVVLTPVKGGYRITLSRRSAERLMDALANADEKAIGRAIRDEANRRKGEPDPAGADGVAQLELVALVVSNQLPAFKKALAEKTGPHGAVVTVTGLQAPAVKLGKARPRLERAAEVARGVMPLLPDQARDTLEGLRAIGRTTPLFWTVEPR